MKKKDLMKLRERKLEDLKSLADKTRDELIKIGLNLAAKREKNLKMVKSQRRELAQILTIIKEKEILQKESKKINEDGKKA